MFRLCTNNQQLKQDLKVARWGGVALALLNWSYFIQIVSSIVMKVSGLEGELIRVTHQIIICYDKQRDAFYLFVSSWGTFLALPV